MQSRCDHERHTSRIRERLYFKEMMMMIGDHPTVEIPSADGEDSSGYLAMMERYRSALAALYQHLPWDGDAVANDDSDDSEVPADLFSCDNFRMFEFKVKKCARARSHDWTECPFAHPGEKARRRDPRRCHYSGSPCPDFRRGACKRGDNCEYAHGVFECWLHPARYRTEPCKDGIRCRRPVCFFAHTPEQLRVLPYTSPDASPSRLGQDSFIASGLFSSPSSPTTWPASRQSINSLTESLSKMNIGFGSPRSLPSWNPAFGSPPMLRQPFTSLPSTPIGGHNRRPGLQAFDLWEASREEKQMDSGGERRERFPMKLGVDRVVRADSPGPDVGWISELIE